MKFPDIIKEKYNNYSAAGFSDTISNLTDLSAGTKPEGLNPKASIDMEKIGIDKSNQVSKNIQNYQQIKLLEWQVY